jgi:dipeptidyl aminopeptidase/acylaminoacyl peptidase
MFRASTFRVIAILGSLPFAALPAGFKAADYEKLRSVDEVEFSPNGARIAYAIARNDLPGRPVHQLAILTLSSGATMLLSSGNEPSANLRWSPNGKLIAYNGVLNGHSGLLVANEDGSGKRFVAAMESTNTPLPMPGSAISWSPDSKQIAYVSAQPGPEDADASGDPMVITRYLYRPNLSEGNTRFNDNKRFHIFVADLESGKSRQLTSGQYYEHSVDWSPDGTRILFVSNRESNPDQFFNYDLFTVEPGNGAIHRLTSTESAEYRPRWSPDGKTIAYQASTRGITDLETTMEDTHIWLMDADGKNRHELAPNFDYRQLEPAWSSDGRSVFSIVRQHGSIEIYRLPVDGGSPTAIVQDPGSVLAFSPHDDQIAYAFTPMNDSAQLFIKSLNGPSRQLTSLNKDVMQGKQVEPVESFTYVSNDFKWNIQAFLTYPANFDASRKYPMIVTIHGGPHLQIGPAFDFKSQVYASHGWAVLQINYRGSGGYGQKFLDAIFADQNGNEGQDVLYGVSAALRRYLWIDRDRLGVEGTSYGGQLTGWLITQTSEFKAAIPAAAMLNLISYNYMTYYNQYEAMEWGQFPHQGNLMDILWERSALKHVANVRTPVMLLHGENDNDVPIAESEQFYIALKDVGVDTVMVRYPREGHGFREPKHIVDVIDRSMAWFDKYFAQVKN